MLSLYRPFGGVLSKQMRSQDSGDESYYILCPSLPICPSRELRDTTEILARNDKTCGDSKSQNSHESLLDLPFLSAATDPKAPVY